MRLAAPHSLDRWRAATEHGAMHVATIGEFSSMALPASIDDGSVHVWFLADWPAPRHAAESAALRGLLARYLGAAADDVRIVRDTHGKPRVADADLEFNLAHTASSALVAIGRGTALGVDLERVGRKRPVRELARRFFAVSEADALDAVDETGQQAAFLDLWCCKEAVLKALGRGLSFGLDRVVFALDGSGKVQRIARIDESATSAWQVLRLCPAPNFVGALAWQGPARAVHVCRAPPLV